MAQRKPTSRLRSRYNRHRADSITMMCGTDFSEHVVLAAQEADAIAKWLTHPHSPLADERGFSSLHLHTIAQRSSCTLTIFLCKEPHEAGARVAGEPLPLCHPSQSCHTPSCDACLAPAGAVPLAPGSLPRYSGVPAARAGWQQGPQAAPPAPAACVAGGAVDAGTFQSGEQRCSIRSDYDIAGQSGDCHRG
jgi:hypothetical protein